MSACTASCGPDAPATKRPRGGVQKPAEGSVAPETAHRARLRGHEDRKKRNQQRHREGVECSEQDARRDGAEKDRDVGTQIPQDAEIEPQSSVLRPLGSRRATGTIISSGEMPPCRKDPR